MLKRLQYVVKAETFDCQEEGYRALIFTAEGDMRYALNNLQATAAGFDKINKDNVFKVCDQPHPELMEGVVRQCIQGNFSQAC